MDIERKNVKVEFGQLKPGDVFDISGAICMKLKDDLGGNNTVDLKSGNCRTIQEETLVSELKANLVVR